MSPQRLGATQQPAEVGATRRGELRGDGELPGRQGGAQTFANRGGRSAEGAHAASTAAGGRSAGCSPSTPVEAR